jgi:uncharacterized membrane protein (UPF0127 family)
VKKTRFVLFSLAVIIGLLFSARIFLAKPTVPPSPLRAIITPSLTPAQTPTQTISSGSKFNSIKIGVNELSVETVSTPDEIQLGLSGRKEIGSDGMLFMINPPRQISFWMKDMLIPLDIVWISNGKITGIENNVLPPIKGTPDDQLTNYPSPNTVDYVLELKAGDAEFWSIKVGDNITIPQL